MAVSFLLKKPHSNTGFYTRVLVVESLIFL